MQPDVILLNDIMPVMDGLGVLEQLHRTPPAKMPHIIANGTSGQDIIAHMLLHSGAEYFMEKPFDADILLRRIRMVCAQEAEQGNQTAASSKHIVSAAEEKGNLRRDNASPEKLVLQMVISLGIPTNLIGHDYIQEALCILIRCSAARPTLKEIYEMIAEQHDSDGRCVENAISCAIKAALVNRTIDMAQLLAMLPDGRTQTISNGKFLTLAAQRIRLTSL